MDMCPCGSGVGYLACCGRFIEGEEIPETPEQLMRSRYTAYTRKNFNYLANTAVGPAARDFKTNDMDAWSEHVVWHGLQILHVTPIADDRGEVEFLAKCDIKGKKFTLHEISEFRRLDDGRWYYFNARYPKVGRNDLCPCGSGKKYKKCCGS